MPLFFVARPILAAAQRFVSALPRQFGMLDQRRSCAVRGVIESWVLTLVEEAPRRISALQAERLRHAGIGIVIS
jgi:hypothetical protein